VRSFEDLAVFKRASRVSLEVHRKSLVCRAFVLSRVGAVVVALIPDPWFLSSDVVAERSVGLRRWGVSPAGGIGSENADMSSDKQSEKLCRRKSKGSCARLIRAG
jgi:hypothetical protein